MEQLMWQSKSSLKSDVALIFLIDVIIIIKL